MKHAHVCLTTQEIEARLKGAGIQPTLQRISICRYVLCDAEHPTAEEIHAWAAKNLATISLATIYNTLNTLVNAGLIKQFRFPVGDKVIYDNNLESHHHFFDTKTQKIIDIHLDRVEIETKLGKQFRVDDIKLFITGEMTGDPKTVNPNKNQKNKQRSS